MLVASNGMSPIAQLICCERTPCTLGRFGRHREESGEQRDVLKSASHREAATPPEPAPDGRGIRF
jgi:hypothetical protein